MWCLFSWGYLLGGTVGVGTVVSMLLTGFIVQFWLPITKKPIESWAWCDTIRSGSIIPKEERVWGGKRSVIRNLTREGLFENAGHRARFRS